MKELQKVLKACESDAEIIAFLSVCLLGVIAWCVLCIWAPGWLIRLIALPMGVVIINSCGKVKAWIDKAEEKAAEDNKLETAFYSENED